MNIGAFVRAEIDADEAWARACSDRVGEGGPDFAAGAHWAWVTGLDQKTVPVPAMPRTDGAESVEEFGTLVWLATAETWTVTEDGDEMDVRGGYADGIHDLDGAAGGHIIRHDPARVLAGVAAKRALLELVLADQNANGGKNSDPWNQVMRLLALEYRDRPGYRQAWVPR